MPAAGSVHGYEWEWDYVDFGFGGSGDAEEYAGVDAATYASVGGLAELRLRGSFRVGP